MFFKTSVTSPPVYQWRKWGPEGLSGLIKTILRFETQESPLLILMAFTAVPSMDEQSAILVLCVFGRKKMKRKIIRIVLRENFGFFKSERKCRKELQWKSGGILGPCLLGEGTYYSSLSLGSKVNHSACSEQPAERLFPMGLLKTSQQTPRHFPHGRPII